MAEYKKLANGIEIVTDPAPSCETLSINVSFRVGSCDEGDAPHGIAHFMEHMAFKGTATRSATDISDEITGRGGFINATTDWDTTSFTCTTMKEELAHSIDVLADIVTRPRLALEDVEIERNVILQEMEERKGTWSTLDECFYTSAYGEQDLSRPIIGTDEGVRAVTPDKLRWFMEQHYVTGNLMVAVAGDVRHADTVALVEEKFARLPTGPRNSMPSFEYYGGEQGFACSCERGIVRYGFEAPTNGTPGAATAALFRSLAAVGPASRMYRELRERRGLIYDVSGYQTTHCGSSMTVFTTEGHAAKIRDIFLSMHEVLGGLCETLTEEELERMRRINIATMRMHRDSVTSRTDAAIFELVSAGKVFDLAADRKAYEAVTVEDAKAYGRALFASPATLAVHGPARGMPKLASLKASRGPKSVRKAA